jgi:hypothetical protein
MIYSSALLRPPKRDDFDLELERFVADLRIDAKFAASQPSAF